MQAARTRDGVDAQFVECVTVTNQYVGQYERHLDLILERVFLRGRDSRAQMRDDAVIASEHRVRGRDAMYVARGRISHRYTRVSVLRVDDSCVTS